MNLLLSFTQFLWFSILGYCWLNLWSIDRIRWTQENTRQTMIQTQNVKRNFLDFMGHPQKSVFNLPFFKNHKIFVTEFENFQKFSHFLKHVSKLDRPENFLSENFWNFWQKQNHESGWFSSKQNAQRCYKHWLHQDCFCPMWRIVLAAVDFSILFPTICKKMWRHCWEIVKTYRDSDFLYNVLNL